MDLPIGSTATWGFAVTAHSRVSGIATYYASHGGNAKSYGDVTGRYVDEVQLCPKKSKPDYQPYSYCQLASLATWTHIRDLEHSRNCVGIPQQWANQFQHQIPLPYVLLSWKLDGVHHPADDEMVTGNDPA